MNEVTAVARIKEIFTQDYQISADKIAEVVNICDELNEILSSQENPDFEFYLHFLQNLRLFFNSEFLFLSNRMNKALNNYHKLQEGISKIQSKFPDFYAQWQYDIDRLLLRTDARIQNLRARTTFEENDLAQAEILFTEAIKRYSNELEMEQERQDYYHYFDSLRNIYYVTGLLYDLRGKSTLKSDEMYQALRFFRKARFLGQESSNDDFNETRTQIIKLGLEKLEKQAESFFTTGVLHSENEAYNKASLEYNKSAQLYRSLRKIQSNIEYELQEQMQMSSYYEALAKDSMAKDNHEFAATNFTYAYKILDGMLSKLPGEELANSFKPQILYFNAMTMFCNAVVEYDQLMPEAMAHFTEATQVLESAKAKAEELNNIPLIDGCTEAINKLNSYQNIAEIMFQSDGLSEE
ncbi:hypothetical protein CEE45_11175 [Candidatus Heimdallarchaeota archaeon B3_Heim]|nr:MAG: hypothetical protein CEE45_11175 [Candidatus Heimdallarchaeota archaeon B3_Heim]